MAAMTLESPPKLIGARRFRDALTGVALALVCGTGTAANTCQLIKIADLPIKLESNHVYVEGTINGRTVDVMLDTGAMRSFVPRSMLLGADFLFSHRVFITHSQRKIYFTYAGGPVFQLTGPLTISERPSVDDDVKP